MRSRDGHQLIVLRAIMAFFPPASPASQDFQTAYDELLANAPPEDKDDVRVSEEIWNYWSAVATGKDQGYDAKGRRTTPAPAKLSLGGP